MPGRQPARGYFTNRTVGLRLPSGEDLLVAYLAQLLGTKPGEMRSSAELRGKLRLSDASGGVNEEELA
jgi:hypothetical protein